MSSPSRWFFVAVTTIGALLLVSGVLGPSRIPALGHLGLMLAGIVLVAVGLVGAIRPRPPVATVLTAPPTPPAPPRPPRAVPEPTVFAEPGEGLQLRDARIDEDGAVAGAGSIAFPSSADGLFVAAEATEVRLVADASSFLQLHACRTRRDERTGYLAIETVGPTLQLSHELGDLLLHCLRHPPKEPRTFMLDGTGRMWTGTDGHRIEQGLTDIRGTVVLEDETIRFEVSAELRTPGWFPVSVGQIEHWEGAPGSRLKLRLALDPLTRVVRFGGYANGFAGGDPFARSPVIPASRGGLDLRTAPIGVLDALYGVRADDSLVHILDQRIWNSAPALSLSGPRPAVRAPSGLVARANTWPRTRIVGIDLDIVAAMLSPRRPRFAMDMTSDVVGYIEYSSGGSDGPGPGADLLTASVEFRVVDGGVLFTYRALPEGKPEVGDALLLRWEALTIRNSGFAELRRAVLDR